MIKAKRYLGVIDAHPEDFQNFWQREDQAFAKLVRERERDREPRPWWLDSVSRTGFHCGLFTYHQEGA